MLVAIGILIGLIVGGVGVAVAVGVLGKSRLGAAEQQRRLMLEEATRELKTVPDDWFEVARAFFG